ncbi:GSU2403 family nucleotidyltransferase fold protein [Rhizobium sp. RM]|uniref:GSU2403 family nucleotidyltransferase fold protein n=1 Tax=Rhizobium sp. RM TaxID=2748079 RepID=UPI0033659333
MGDGSAHGAGVSVVVPDPSRFAVHKLIVAGQRQDDAAGRAKKEKDLRQAGMLFEALRETGAGRDLEDSLREAWGRGPSWRSAITAGVDAVRREWSAKLPHARRSCLTKQRHSFNANAILSSSRFRRLRWQPKFMRMNRAQTDSCSAIGTNVEVGKVSSSGEFGSARLRMLKFVIRTLFA